MLLTLVGISDKTELEQSSLFCSINAILSLTDVIPQDYKDLATSLSVFEYSPSLRIHNHLT